MIISLQQEIDVLSKRNTNQQQPVAAAMPTDGEENGFKGLMLSAEIASCFIFVFNKYHDIPDTQNKKQVVIAACKNQVKLRNLNAHPNIDHDRAKELTHSLLANCGVDHTAFGPDFVHRVHGLYQQRKQNNEDKKSSRQRSPNPRSGGNLRSTPPPPPLPSNAQWSAPPQNHQQNGREQHRWGGNGYGSPHIQSQRNGTPHDHTGRSYSHGARPSKNRNSQRPGPPWT